MKKVLLFVAVLTAASFASCKKDRVCTCTTTDKATGVVTTEATTYHEVKKGDARQMCVGSVTTTTYSTGGGGTGDDTTCELK